jgi:hypothetical protein
MQDKRRSNEQQGARRNAEIAATNRVSAELTRVDPKEHGKPEQSRTLTPVLDKLSQLFGESGWHMTSWEIVFGIQPSDSPNVRPGSNQRHSAQVREVGHCCSAVYPVDNGVGIGSPAFFSPLM